MVVWKLNEFLHVRICEWHVAKCELYCYSQFSKQLYHGNLFSAKLSWFHWTTAGDYERLNSHGFLHQKPGSHNLEILGGHGKLQFPKLVKDISKRLKVIISIARRMLQSIFIWAHFFQAMLSSRHLKRCPDEIARESILIIFSIQEMKLSWCIIHALGVRFSKRKSNHCIYKVLT